MFLGTNVHFGFDLFDVGFQPRQWVEDLHFMLFSCYFSITSESTFRKSAWPFWKRFSPFKLFLVISIIMAHFINLLKFKNIYSCCFAIFRPSFHRNDQDYNCDASVINWRYLCDSAKMWKLFLFISYLIHFVNGLCLKVALWYVYSGWWLYSKSDPCYWMLRQMNLSGEQT